MVRTCADGFSDTADHKIQRLDLGDNRRCTREFHRPAESDGNGSPADGDGILRNSVYEYGELENGIVNNGKNSGNIDKQAVSFNRVTNPLVQTSKYDSFYLRTESRETSAKGTSAPAAWKRSFGYDGCGNRTGLVTNVGTTQSVNKSKTRRTIGPNTNRFNPDQGIYFDKNGDLTDEAEA